MGIFYPKYTCKSHKIKVMEELTKNLNSSRSDRDDVNKKLLDKGCTLFLVIMAILFILILILYYIYSEFSKW